MTVQALSGVRVVECGGGVAAPFCSRLLGDLGAEIVKVEPPGGDPVRAWGPFQEDSPDPEAGGTFHFLNAGKRSVVADLDDAERRSWLDAQLAGADLFIESLEDAQRRSWELDFDALLQRHPHLVVVSLSPYGRSGPWADRPGTDLTASAMSSLPLGLGEPHREPLSLPYDQSDYQAGLHGAAAALCALHEQRRSGRGQGVDVATAQVMAYCVGGMSLVAAKAGATWRRRGKLQGGTIYPTGFFECRDGFICIASQTPKQWKMFLDLMGNPEWAEAEHASDPVHLGAVDATPADSHFRAWLSGYTRRELVEMAMEVGIVLGTVNTAPEVLASDQLDYRGVWAELKLDGTSLRVPKPGYLLSGTPVEIGAAAPTLDADERTLSEGSPRPSPTPGGDETAERRPPLDGIRVLDFGWNWAGPMAGQLLADMGAEVIRVETKKRQDLMRFLDFTSYFFCHNNRSKKSITVDVTAPGGAEMVRDLVRQVDIVMDNFSAGVMERNGLGYDDLRAANPGIICVSMSMAGQQGPLKGMRGFASIATGFAGLEQLVGYDDGEAVGLLPFGLGDTTLAVQGALGALAALHARDRTGEGQFVDVSQIESAVATLAEPLIDFQMNGRLPQPRGNRHSTLAPHGLYRCEGEDRWVAVAVRDDADWRALAGVLGQEEWAEGPAPKAGTEEADEAGRVLSEWCVGRSRDEAVGVLAAAGVPAAPVLELRERDAHDHFVERGLVLDHSGGTFDACRVYATPWMFTATPPEMTRPAPALGEHNREIFEDLMGLSPERVQELVEAGILV